jgi:hypothetical protein
MGLMSDIHAVPGVHTISDFGFHICDNSINILSILDEFVGS